MKIFLLSLSAFSAFIFNKVQHPLGDYRLPFLSPFENLSKNNKGFVDADVFKLILSKVFKIDAEKSLQYSIESDQNHQIFLTKGNKDLQKMKLSDFRRKVASVYLEDETINKELRDRIATSDLPKKEKESFYEKVKVKAVELSSNDKNELVISYINFNGIEAAITLASVLFIGGALSFLPKMNASEIPAESVAA